MDFSFSLSFFKSLDNVKISALLKLVFYSSAVAILILAISTVIIDKVSSSNQKRLVEHIIQVESLTKLLNGDITTFIRRNNEIALTRNGEELEQILDRSAMENSFEQQLQELEDFIRSNNNNIVKTEPLKKLYKQFLQADTDLYEKQAMLHSLKSTLIGNTIALEKNVSGINDAVEAASGKIRLLASRARRAINSSYNTSPEKQDNQAFKNGAFTIEQRVQNASHQVQSSALQIVQLSRKLTQINNRDELISVRDNEIAQEISQIEIALNILSADLQDYPGLMQDVSRVQDHLTSLINVLLTNGISIYNLRTQILDLNTGIDTHRRLLATKAKDMESLLDEIEMSLSMTLEDEKRETDKKSQMSRFIVLFLCVLVIIFITSNFRILVNRITQPLLRISGAVNDLSKGELTSRLSEQEFAADEFWSVADTFNHFAERNEDLINELSTARDALQENEDQLKAILENALVGIVHLVERRFISVNQRFEEMFGYDRNNIEGLRTEILFASHDDFIAVGIEAYDNFRKGKTYHKEWLLQHQNGTQFWCAISAKSIVDGHPEQGTIWLYEDISERKETEQQLIALANYDTLTSLPNRSLFIDRLTNHLELAKRNDEMLAVMFIDLDRFKQINDSLGHEAGDILLIEIAKRLKTCIRKSDTVARLGGDEFTILLLGLKNKMVPARTADKIIQALNEPILIDQQEIHISPSIGISMYPSDGRGAAELLRNADAAMYYAKNSGRNNYQFYTSEMNAESLKKLTLESKLRGALERNEFQMYFQPLVNASNTQTIGYEALLRWHDQDNGLIPPDIFIPILEETGLIESVGEWIIYDCCRSTQKLLQENATSIRTSINLSARQFQNKRLVNTIKKATAKYNLTPEDIVFEITETVLMTGSDTQLNTLNKLHNSGYKILLDDFGTGYSSLAYLKRFPISAIKIDRSFIRDILTNPNDAGICDAIKAMADNLNISVIAEGVETQEQLDYLKERSFTYMQGYYFGKPAPLKEILITSKKPELKLIS